MYALASRNMLHGPCIIEDENGCEQTTWKSKDGEEDPEKENRQLTIIWKQQLFSNDSYIAHDMSKGPNEVLNE